MPGPPGPQSDERAGAARAFVRSLNIAVKSGRLYGVDHDRTATQLETAWSELQGALATAGKTGLLLGVSGQHLLLDGAPLESGPAERGLTDLLTAAQLASIQFSAELSREDMARFVRVLTTAKPAELADSLKDGLGQPPAGLRLNQFHFVAEEESITEARAAAALTARTLGADAETVQNWLNDPQKLLQLIAAAEGAQTVRSSATPGEPGGLTAADSRQASGPAGTAAAAAPAGAQASPEEDWTSLMRWLAQLGRAGGPNEAGTPLGALQEQLGSLPGGAREALQHGLAGLAGNPSALAPDKPMLLQLAEHLAIRFALQRYERGEVRVNAVRELLHRMGKEVDTLRQVLSAHEEKLTRAGLVPESHADILDRQFWAQVPERNKRSVLLSPDAWCIPPRNVAQFVDGMRQRGQAGAAAEILENYALAICQADPEARRRAVLGLTELAPQYAAIGGSLLVKALALVGDQLRNESEPELQTLLSAAFTRLSQEAAARHHFPALQQSLASLARLEQAQPTLASSLRPRIAVESRLGDFVESALRNGELPAGLVEMLRAIPEAAAQLLCQRFARCARRNERERLVNLACEVGTRLTRQLKEILTSRPANEAAATVGLLSRLDPGAIEESLPPRLGGWNRTFHDQVVRLLAAGGSPERGRLLLKLLNALDFSAISEALDEIGLSGDRFIVLPLIRLVGGQLPQSSEPYFRLKAVEALGRLGDPAAAEHLRNLLQAKQLWRPLYPREMRIAAAQALQTLDPNWAKYNLPRLGFTSAELSLAPLEPQPDVPWVRQRRYARYLLPQSLSGVASSLRGDARFKVKVLSLGGGLASSDQALPAGIEARFQLKSGMRSLSSRVLVRDTRAYHVGFEFTHVDLAERAKLRRLLTSTHTQPA